MSREGGTRGGGWVRLQGANGMAVSGLSCRKALVGIGWSISVLFDIIGLRNKPSHLFGLCFQHSWPIFSTTPG